MKLEGLKMVFLGDSITQGIGASCPENVYHAIVAKQTGAVAKNFGISGTRYANQRGTEKRPFLQYEDSNPFYVRVDRMDDDADIVVVFGGVNDYSHGDMPIGHFGDTTPDTFYGACYDLYMRLIKKYLGKTIVIMTPLHMVDENKIPEIKDDGQYGLLVDYVNAIKQVAAYFSLPVLDLYAVSTIQPAIEQVREKYMPDGIHPNDEGHKIVAHKLKTFLEAL